MHDAPSSIEACLAALERLIRRDPGRRGLIDAEAVRGPLCAGHLGAAADHLARCGQTVWIITGFFIPGANPPAAETDGPPGAALLAAALQACGMQVRLITDEPCAAAVRVAARLYGLAAEAVTVCPVDPSEFDKWVQSCWGLPAVEPVADDRLRDEFSRLTHLIAIERVGPSHTLATYAGSRPVHDADVQRFLSLVPSEHHDRCHNMRGEIIDAHTAPLHRLLEQAQRLRPGLRTIGIGDGGNELGLGAVSWDELQCRLNGPAAPLVPCRVATDWTIVAGVSNWGGQALAASVCRLRERTDILSPWDIAAEERRLQSLVQDGPAVDGVTRLRQPTVDGLPFLTSIQPWEGMRRELGLA